MTLPLVADRYSYLGDKFYSCAARSTRLNAAAGKLLETMTTMAGERGLQTLDLTSRPWRESALRLYEAVAFRRRETNILRYTP